MPWNRCPVCVEYTRGLGRVVQHLGEQVAQAPALGRQGPADQLLQGRVAGPDDLVFVEVGDQLGDDEAGCDVAPNDMGGLFRELREKVRRPQSIAEQLRDPGTLGVMFVPGDGMRLECLSVEIAVQYKDGIVLDIVPGKAEESALGFEVADLKGAVDVGVQAGTTRCV